MMSPGEMDSSMQEQTAQTYKGYEGSQASSARQHYEQTYGQEQHEGLSSKVYPQPRDNKNLLRFALAVVAMVMILLCGVLFVVLVGGTGGWISFASACLAIFIIAAIGIDKIH